MKKISIRTSWTGDAGQSEWEAQYQVTRGTDAIHVKMIARSELEVVVVKLPDVYGYGGSNYYISSPNFGIAIPSISSLYEAFWITEQFIKLGMPEPDAMTVAQVLQDIGDF